MATIKFYDSTIVGIRYLFFCKGDQIQERINCYGISFGFLVYWKIDRYIYSCDKNV